MVNIYAKKNIREIGSVASRKENKKGRKPAPINHPKFSQTEPNLSTINVTKPPSNDDLTIKILVKK